jgi:hypothetical protein
MKQGSQVTKRRYSHAREVASFFEDLPACSDASAQWLSGLQRQALRERAGWKAEAEAFLQGLAAQGAVPTESIDRHRERLARCRAPSPGVVAMLLPPLWIAAVAAAAFAVRTLAPGVLLAGVAALCAALGAAWASSRPWLCRRDDPAQPKWLRPTVICASAALVPMGTISLALLVGDGMQALSIKRYEADRASFSTDARGFPLLQRFARDVYGIDVVLRDAGESWASTSLAIPGASPASMTVAPSVCLLALNRAVLLKDPARPQKVDPTSWVQGVMFHEFAHCLDEVRDIRSAGDRTLGTGSLAPRDAKGASSALDFYQASLRPSTQLWREAVADVVAIGYWRLTAAGDADALAEALGRKRADNERDVAHSTSCWIAHARNAPPPDSLAGLFDWAVALRSSARCDLDAVALPAPGGA